MQIPGYFSFLLSNDLGPSILFLLHLYVSPYICSVYLFVRTHVYAHMRAQYRGQRILTSIILRNAFYLDWSSPIRLEYLGREPQRPSCFSLPTAGITSMIWNHKHKQPHLAFFFLFCLYSPWGRVSVYSSWLS